ncbi:hypothetical protein [Mycolicibacter virginiensis]|uniref:hypothetical protein n=1 Tax=Mycolicibacter virginiensis TaxID=1795032 RepID=UPI001F03A02D|nr:hypothetical protein [Mycolicibacter virginiensis]ULP45941.1 hypothetical protein MJO54_13805 [Mycolicibacter virginiensis]
MLSSEVLLASRLTVHDVNSNRFVQAAVEQLDGWLDAMALVDTAQAAVLNTLPPVAECPVELDPFLTGKVEEEWIDARLRRSAELARREQRQTTLRDLMHEAQMRAETIIVTKIDDVLAALNCELENQLADAARIVDKLGPVRTAGQAIEADVAPAWKALTKLSGDYELLRAGQELVMTQCASQAWRSAGSWGGREAPASTAYLRNIDELWPDWRNPGQGTKRVTRLDGQPHRYEPWPTDPVELLAWLVTSEAQPWIPTRKQLAELHEERRRRRNPNPKPSNQPGPLLNRTPKSRGRFLGVPLG